jgi:ribosomal RNA-processing protein 12
VPIAHALRRLCAQTRAALAAAGEPVGHADPSARREAGGDDEEDEKEEEDDADPDAVPPHATAKATRRALAALRAGARGWMPLLLDATLAAPPHQRGPLEAAASAYACACDAPTVAALFRSAVGQLVAAGGGGAGDDPERRAALLGVALALAGGLDAVGAEVLYRAALPGAAARHPALQKRSYKALAYLCESRPDFFEPRFGEVVAALLAASGAAASAAKRHRLRCLKAAALELLRPGGPDVDPAALPGVAPPPPPPGGFPSAAAARGARARAVLAPLLAEIVLGVKETNKRSRGAAYALLIEVAGAAHAAEPPGGPGGGGLRALFGLLLAGLAGATPHMVSATVVALARLLFEYAPVLAGLVPELLPAVLGLLRSPAREVVKSALGFVKVAALRLPADELARFVPGIVEGCLLWAEDSRNKFRAKVRSILERLVARVGIAPVEAAAPESARRLLAHLRRQLGRRERRRRSEAGSRHGGGARGGGGGDDDARSRRTRGERTAAPSRWDSEALDSEEEDGDGDATFRGAVTEGARSHGARTARGDGPARTLRRGARTERGGSERGGGAGGARRLPAGGDPLDLLDAAASRRLVRAGGGRRAATAGRADDDDEGGDFERDARGRMLIRDEDAEAAAAAGAKRKRGGAAAALGVDSDDSDAEEFKGFSGLDLALRGARSVGAAPSLGGRSAGGRSAGGASRGGGRGGRGGGRSGGRGGGRAAPRRGPQHSGDRFRARGAAGDVRGRSAVEPYAYWPLDRSMLNRRAAKQRQAKLGLGKVVSGGAAKGGKGSARGAKRARHSDA